MPDLPLVLSLSLLVTISTLFHVPLANRPQFAHFFLSPLSSFPNKARKDNRIRLNVFGRRTVEPQYTDVPRGW